MTLPTVQPFDYPDWGTPGIFQTVTYNVAAVALSGEVIAQVATGYFNHALVVFDGNGDGQSYQVELQYYTANPVEGGQLLWSNTVVVRNDYMVVVPMTSGGGWLRLVDVDATAYPHNALFSITLFSAWGTLTGWPGGVTAISEVQTVVAGDGYDFVPTGCGPGAHTVQLSTDSTVWTLALYIWNEVGGFQGGIIADDTTLTPWAIEFSPPATSWFLAFSNNDVTDREIFLSCVRAPT